LVSSNSSLAIYLLLNFLTIIKTKVLFSHACVTLADFGYPADGLWFTCSKKIISLFF
jgi:hypothetical protein